MWHPPGLTSHLARETREQREPTGTQSSCHLFCRSSKSFVSVPEVSCLLPAFTDLAGRLLACKQSKISDPPRFLAVRCLALTPAQLLGGWVQAVPGHWWGVNKQWLKQWWEVGYSPALTSYSEFPPRMPAAQHALGPGSQNSILSGGSWQWGWACGTRGQGSSLVERQSFLTTPSGASLFKGSLYDEFEICLSGPSSVHKYA